MDARFRMETDRLIRRARDDGYRPNTGIAGYISYHGQNWPFVGAMEVELEEGAGTGTVSGEVVEETVPVEGIGRDETASYPDTSSYHTRSTGLITNLVGGSIRESGEESYALVLEKVPRDPSVAEITGPFDWLLESEETLRDDPYLHEYHFMGEDGFDEYIGRYIGSFKPSEHEFPADARAKVEAKLTMIPPTPDDIDEWFAERKFPNWVKKAVENPA